MVKIGLLIALCKLWINFMEVSMSYHNAGFTFVELLVVIAVVGMFIVSVAPQFSNLQTEARLSRLHSLEYSLHSINGTAKSYGVMQGTNFFSIRKNIDCTDNQCVEFNGMHYPMKYGFLEGAYIGNLVEGAEDTSNEYSVIMYRGVSVKLLKPRNEICETLSGTCNREWCDCTSNVLSSESQIFIPKGVEISTAINNKCYLQYDNASSKVQPAKITVHVEGC